VSPDGRHVLSGSQDRSLRLWDIETGVEVRRWGGGEYGVRAVAFAPDGRHAISAGSATPPRLWDTATGTEVRRFETKSNSEALTVAFAPDGRLVLTADRDHLVRCWDAQTGQELRRFVGHEAEVVSVAFSPDRVYALSGEADIDRDGVVRLWELQSGREFRRLGEMLCFVNAVTFSADGSLVFATTMDARLYGWDVASGRDAFAVDVGVGNLLCVAASRCGRWLLTGSGTDFHTADTVASLGTDNTVRLLDAANGRELRRFDGHTGNVNAVAFTPRSDYAVSASSDRSVRVWSLPH
jgi:WD40 repeat protein